MKGISHTIIPAILSIFLLAGALSAQSPFIVQNTAGTFTTASLPGFCPCYFGMTFTTPNGGPWNNITFTSYGTPAVGSTPASNPQAAGTGFLLTQPYFGTPANLSSSTPGYVASTSTIAGGFWTFSPTVVLNPNTQYWAYANAPLPNGTGTNNGQPGATLPNLFYTQSASQNFLEGEGVVNFALGGTPVSSGTCSYTVSPGGLTVFFPGGSLTFSVNAPAGCAWTATSTVSWMTITGGASGTGNGTVTFQVAPNTGPAQTGSINITSATGNVSFTVIQSAASIAGYTNAGAIAQLASAGGWTTTFTFVNTGTTAAQMRLNFYKGDGTPLSIPLNFPQSPNAAGPIFAGTIDQTIAPGAELVLQTTGGINQPIKTGWAQLFTNGSITGFATYSEVIGSGVQDALVPLQPGNSPGYVIPYDNTSGAGTAVALVNTTTGAINVNVTVVISGGAGSTIDQLTDFTTTLPLPPRNYTAFFVSSQFSDTAGVRGTLKFSTGTPGQISVLGLRFNASGAFSSTPAIPTSN